ncbi:hypothetical protein LB505_005221 [Fusarium chuoi]|nr:hypothetical protein LB505_005221 [Fusarium chuoi]
MDNLQVSGVTINSLESPRGTSSEPLKSSLGFRIWKMSEKLLKSIPRTGHCVTLAVGMGHGKLLANNYSHSDNEFLSTLGVCVWSVEG